MGDIRSILEFYQAIGIDECIGTEPVDRFAVVAAKQAAKLEARQSSAAAAPAMPPPPQGAQRNLPPNAAQSPMAPAASTRAAASNTAARPPAQAALEAQQLAQSCQNLEELEQALASFDGCGLRQTASHTVFSDGNPAADIMIIGDAPASDDDRIGRAFAGERGDFLDRMTASIGLFRQMAKEEDDATAIPGNVYISNLVFWRPPGNRKPTDAEVNVCLPFTLRHIELAAPKIVVPVGAVATAALLKSSSNMLRLRGQWGKIALPDGRNIPALPLFGPDILLKKPLMKREAWQDLLTLKAKMIEDGLALHDPRFVARGPVGDAS